MDWLKEKIPHLFLAYINLMFICNVMEISYKIQHFSYLYVSGIFFISLVIYWFYSAVLKRARYRILFTILIIIVSSIIYHYKYSIINPIAISWYYDTVISINDQVYNLKDTFFFQFKPLFTAGIPILVLILMPIISGRLGNTLLVITLAYMTVLWYTGYTNEVKKVLGDYIFVSLITFSINGYVKKVRKLNKEGIKIAKQGGKIAIYIVIVCFFIAQAIKVLPQTYQGKFTGEIFSKWQNKFAKEEQDVFNERGNRFGYDLSYSGYDGNNSKLGGSITINNKTAFKVKSEKSLYLKGTIKDFYDGFSWKVSEKNYVKNSSNEDKILSDPFASRFLMLEKNITVYPEELNTSTFFTPNYSFGVSTDQNTSIYHTNIPTFLNEDMINKPYTVKYYSTRGDIDTFNDDWVLNKNKYAQDRVVYSFLMNNNTDNVYDKSQFAKYLQVPSNISPEIIDLVRNITKNSKNDFEKVEKIKQYLQANYKYSLNVSSVPDGQEFLSYFLFNEKKGYCTYFATATTIFCRLAGIPARYVEGFHMVDKLDSNGFYVVSNENAHAWTEVLFYPNRNGGIWSTVDCVPNSTEQLEEEKAQEALNNNQPGGAGEVKTPEKKDRTIDEGDVGGGDSSKANIDPKKVLPIAAAVLIIIYISSRIALYFVRKDKMIKSSSIIPVYRHSLKRLKKVGTEIPENITDMEFFDKIRDNELKAPMADVVKQVYAEFFGHKTSEEYDKNSYYIFIENFVRRRQNIVKYVVNKFFL